MRAMTDTRSTIRPRLISVRFLTLYKGLLLTFGIAIVSIALGKLEVLRTHGISALTIAILLGMVAGNSVFASVAPVCGAGVMFSRQTLLRLGIVLYGLRLTFQDIARVGMDGVVIDALMLISTFGIALFVGLRLLKLDRDTTILIAAGSSICGAAAVMATEPVIKARADKVAVAVSTVVAFGTLSMFLYPWLYQLNLQWHIIGSAAADFGIYIGSTVHEVAQVVAAGKSIGPEVADAAVIAKMVRVMMLAPFLIILAVFLSQLAKRATLSRTPSSASWATVSATSTSTHLAIPWFAFIFVAVVGLNSLNVLPECLLVYVSDVDTLLLAMAMAALGLGTHMSAIRRAGIKPMLLAAIMFAWLVIGGALVSHLLG